MCKSCWEEHGCPSIISKKTLHVAGLIEELYVDEPAGSLLHVVLDDWNIDDSNVKWCMSAECAKVCECEMTPLERSIAEAFLTMTVDERASALALCDGFIERPPLAVT